MTNPLKFWALMITLAVLVLVILLARLDERTAKSSVGDQHGEAAEGSIKIEATPTPSPLPTERPYHNPDNEFPPIQTPVSVLFTGGINGEWLTVRRHEGEKGWNPCFTSIESFYRPVVKQLPDKRWEITFSSEDLTTEF